MKTDIAIIGAGAAGCFAAIEIKRRFPEAVVTVYESGNKALAKVAVTGGGRCNLTNSFSGVSSMETVYPRGARLMKRLLKEFSHEDAYGWFEREGIRLTTQEDNCVFPMSQDAMEIVDKLLWLMRRHGVTLKTGHRVTTITHHERYILTFSNHDSVEADKVVVTTGGSPKLSGLRMLDGLGLDIVEPVPSLFSFCLANHPITEMSGTVVKDVQTSVVGTKMRADGPLLITHWGLSGPAVLKLSSYGARHFHDSDYKTDIAVNWFGPANEGEVTEELSGLAVRHPQKQVQSVYPERFNSRLWLYLLDHAGIRHDMRWAEMGRKSFNRMAAMLTNHVFSVTGKNKFKEEFVTCGGVALSNVNSSTLECRLHSGLYFAGEVLDVDALTGGFNLQAAWTMGYVVAKNIDYFLR